MTKDQKHYTDQKCRLSRGRNSDLCGPAVKRGCNTPLVVSFDDRPVTFSPGGQFSFAPGVATATDWPTSSTPWIAIDLDGDGAITSGAELFGSNTALPGGTTAKNGFEALAALDANHDGKIDRDDPAFASLVCGPAATATRSRRCRARSCRSRSRTAPNRAATRAATARVSARRSPGATRPAYTPAP